MKNSQINFKFEVTSLNTDNQIINQQTLTIQEHLVITKYRMLSNNNIQINGTMLCPGYFNRKTNFIIGEINSIIAVDKNLKTIIGEYSNTSNLIKDNSSFILYPLPCFHMETNDTLNYNDNLTNSSVKINLDKTLGYKIGRFLAGNLSYSDIEVHPGFLRLFINTKNGVSLNKNILLNSNYEFVIAILSGYYEANNFAGFFINSNVNLYTFTTILNYLGASYSIRNSKDLKKLFFQLPIIFKGLIDDKFIKHEQYGYLNEISELQIVNEVSIFNKDNMTLVESINSGKILAIPISSICFEQLTDDEISKMYDLTCERSNATNYALNMTPILKNSDGDILAASGIFTKEGLTSAQEFSPEVREYYKNLNDGEINNWIADDAIIGLYNSTIQKIKK